MADVNFDNIPQELKDAVNWVVWRYVTRDGKQTKVPVNAMTGKNARSNDPATWTTFEVAKRYYETHNNVSGVGFMLGKDYVGIDIDDVVSKDGRINSKYADMVARSSTYVEFSPSGEGLHLIYKGYKPGSHARKGDFEMYDSGRYFTVTGDAFNDNDISDNQHEINDFYEEFLDDKVSQTKNAISKKIDENIRRTDRLQVLTNGFNDKRCNKRFARIPVGIHTCDWCLMLASLGFNYLSEATATAPGHAWCDCAIVPSFGSSTIVQGYSEEKYKKDYDAYKERMRKNGTPIVGVEEYRKALDKYNVIKSKEYYEDNLQDYYASTDYYERRNEKR